MKKPFMILILILCFGCSTKNVTIRPAPEKITNEPAAEKTANQPAPGSDIEEINKKILEEGYKKLISRNPKEAIDKYFNPVIDAYNSNYGNNGSHVYCSRGQAETMFYLLEAVSKSENAVVVSQIWADAFYLKGYASLDLGNIDDAETFIKKALELSPSNSMYLSELGHIYQVQRKWNEAMDLYKEAEESARAYSPENLKHTEITRAIRGIGYCLIELGRLEEAEEEYKKCLEINENDKKALNELKYIQSLRDKNNH